MEDGFDVVLARRLLVCGDCSVAAFRPFVPGDGSVVAGRGSDTLRGDTPSDIHGQKLVGAGYCRCPALVGLRKEFGFANESLGRVAPAEAGTYGLWRFARCVSAPCRLRRLPLRVCCKTGKCRFAAAPAKADAYAWLTKL